MVLNDALGKLTEVEVARNKLRREREDFISSEVYNCRKVATEEADDKYGGSLGVLDAAVMDAQKAVDAARTEETLRTLVHPVGTVLVGWSKEDRGLSGYVWEKTATGVVEVVTESTVFPVNLASWRRPSVGEAVVRANKKDGTPGKNVETIHGSGYDDHLWLPKGKKPK